MAANSTPDGRRWCAPAPTRRPELHPVAADAPPAAANLPVSLLAAVSDQDTDSLPVAFQLQATAPDIVSVSEHARGAHNPAVWKSWLPEMYTWLSQHLARSGRPVG